MSCPLKKARKSSDSLNNSSLKSTNSNSTTISQEEPALKGSCQCGNVKWSSTVLPQAFTNCHCSTCRKLSGSPYITFGDYPRAAITFTGLVQPTSFSDYAVRTHCAACGSPISIQYMCEPEQIHLTAGTIDEESIKGVLPKVTACIFVPKRTGMWYDMDDKIPKFEKFSSGFQRKIDSWRNILTQPGLG